MRGRAAWIARQAHDLKVAGSNPALATIFFGGIEMSEDEGCEGLIINDVEAFEDVLRKMLDEWGIPHICDNCGTTDPKDINLYCCPNVWKCKCGKEFEFKGYQL